MEHFANLLLSSELHSRLLPIKIIFVLITFFFLFFICYFSLKWGWLKVRILLDLVEFFTYRPFGIKKILKQWTKIKSRLETGLESEYKLAIIEADAILADTFEKLGYSGKTLSEKLKNITPTILPNVEKIWQAHNVRNNIVHDPNYRLSLDQAKKVLEIYEEAFKTLELL